MPGWRSMMETIINAPSKGQSGVDSMIVPPSSSFHLCFNIQSQCQNDNVFSWTHKNKISLYAIEFHALTSSKQNFWHLKSSHYLPFSHIDVFKKLREYNFFLTRVVSWSPLYLWLSSFISFLWSQIIIFRAAIKCFQLLYKESNFAIWSCLPVWVPIVLKNMTKSQKNNVYRINFIVKIKKSLHA